MHILLEGLRVSKRGLDLGMAKEPLNLFERHTALEGQTGGGVPENVRSDMAVNSATLHDLLDLVLHCLDGKTVVRSTATDKQSRRFVIPRIKVCTKRNLSFGVEICGSAFATFAALDVNGVIREIDVRDVQSAELRHTAGG